MGTPTTVPGPAVVVGGGSGIGAAVAHRQRVEGGEVVVWDLAGGADVRCDITDVDQVSAAADATLARVGPPATLTITAGIGHAGREIAVQNFSARNNGRRLLELIARIDSP